MCRERAFIAGTHDEAAESRETETPGAEPGICVTRGRPLSFSLEEGSKGLGSAERSSSEVPGGATAENEFGALYSCEKASGGNHFEDSEVHYTTVERRVRRPRGRGAEPARPTSKSATGSLITTSDR